MVLVFEFLFVQLLLKALDDLLGFAVLVLHELHLHRLLPLHCLQLQHLQVFLFKLIFEDFELILVLVVVLLPRFLCVSSPQLYYT